MTGKQRGGGTRRRRCALALLLWELFAVCRSAEGKNPRIELKLSQEDDDVAVESKLFSFVRVPHPGAAASVDFADAAPIGSLVGSRLREAAEEVALFNPDRNFVLKKDDEGRLLLVGVSKRGWWRGEEDRVVYLFDGSGFQKLDDRVTIHENAEETETTAPEEEEEVEVPELDMWKDFGFLTLDQKVVEDSEGDFVEGEESPSPGLPADFDAELLADLGLEPVKRTKRTKRAAAAANGGEADSESVGVEGETDGEEEEEESSGPPADDADAAAAADAAAESRLLHPYEFEMFEQVSEETDDESRSDDDGDGLSERAPAMDDKSSRDLIYEAMKMRTGSTESRDKNAVRPVGGGVLEKQLLGSLDGAGKEALDGGGEGPSLLFSEARNGFQTFMAATLLRTESREMQCCHDLELTSTSTSGVLGCHPYALGVYRKIGACGGRSFYQHANNTDIFLYYACGGWYVGLEIGSCGGWIVAKSLELCASARHQTKWAYFDQGQSREDPTFEVRERCKFYNDFRPIPNQPPPPGHHRPHRPPPPVNYPGQPLYQPKDPHHHHQGDGHQGWHHHEHHHHSGETTANGGSVKHEHFHYHIKMDENSPTRPDYKPVSNHRPQPLAPTQALLEQHDLLHRLGSGGGRHHVRPGDQSLSFDISPGDVAVQHDSLVGGRPFSVKEIVSTSSSQQHYHQPSSSTFVNGQRVKHPNRNQIMINNFHIPASSETSEDGGEEDRERRTTTTTTTTPRPLKVVVVQRPASDLQMYQQNPLPIRDKINQDLITLKYADRGGGGGAFSGHQQDVQQNTPLVGYIIKKRKPEHEYSSFSPSEVYSYYGRNSQHRMEEEEEASGDEDSKHSYFPNRRDKYRGLDEGGATSS